MSNRDSFKIFLSSPFLRVILYAKELMKYSLIYTTTGNETEAKIIGRTLVQEELAACVNIFQVQSIYRWQGKIEDAGEMALFIKTRVELADKVIKRIKELHSYQVPEIVSWSIEKGYPPYLKWITESTKEV